MTEINYHFDNNLIQNGIWFYFVIETVLSNSSFSQFPPNNEVKFYLIYEYFIVTVALKI